jgi:hypothetical protein
MIQTADKTYDFIPVFSVVVSLRDGYISSVIWDNGCYMCAAGPDYCKVHKATVWPPHPAVEWRDQQNCYEKDVTDISRIDPRIYVSFIGTDASGNKMESAGLRWSQFREYSLASTYGSATSTWEAMKKKAAETANSVKSRLLAAFGSDKYALEPEGKN